MTDANPKPVNKVVLAYSVYSDSEGQNTMARGPESS